jgi:hypothetical protein
MAVSAARDARLAEVQGELRDSHGYTWTLQGTFAARAHEKRRNAQVERLLLREAEPWTALAMRGLRNDTALALLHAAWRTLLLCHPHDTLCGCSSDEVARAMDARLDDAMTQAAGIRDDALLRVIGHDDAAARTERHRWRSVAVVRNAAARARSGVAEVELLTFLQDVPVGPGSGGARAKTTRRRGAPVGLGASVPLQILERAVRHDRIESPRHYPDDDLVESATAVAWVPPIGGYGTWSVPLDDTGASASDPPERVHVRDNVIDNGRLTIAVGDDGRVQMRSYPSAHGGSSAQAGWEYVESLELESEAPRVGEEAAALLRAEPCPSGVTTIVVDSEQMVLQVHE